MPAEQLRCHSKIAKVLRLFKALQTQSVAGKNNSHAVEMAEHDPLLHAGAQRSTPHSEPGARQKPAPTGRGLTVTIGAGMWGGAGHQAGSRGLQKQKAEVRSSYPKW